MEGEKLIFLSFQSYYKQINLLKSKSINFDFDLILIIKLSKQISYCYLMWKVIEHLLMLTIKSKPGMFMKSDLEL